MYNQQNFRLFEQMSSNSKSRRTSTVDNGGRKRSSLKSPVSGKSSKQWQLPKNFQRTHVDPLFRHRLQKKFYTLTKCDWLSSAAHQDYAEKLEMFLAIMCNFDAALYEEKASLLLHALKLNPLLTKRYDPSMLICLDDCTLLPEATASLVESQRERETRRVTFETLLKKLTSEVEADGYPSLQCRLCGNCADVNPVQTRSADEPMTCFCTCLNPDCQSKWKM
jgi:DNA-directed RNA polymerase subunit M/transcription elongation factor TFIIS